MKKLLGALLVSIFCLMASEAFAQAANHAENTVTYQNTISGAQTTIPTCANGSVLQYNGQEYVCTSNNVAMACPAPSVMQTVNGSGAFTCIAPPPPPVVNCGANAVITNISPPTCAPAPPVPNCPPKQVLTSPPAPNPAGFQCIDATKAYGNIPIGTLTLAHPQCTNSQALVPGSISAVFSAWCVAACSRYCQNMGLGYIGGTIVEYDGAAQQAECVCAM